MLKLTSSSDPAVTTQRHEGIFVSGESLAIGPPVVIAATTNIRAGSVLIKADAQLPESAHFAFARYGSWNLLTGADGFTVDRWLSQSGWHFVVPEIKVGALSLNRKHALRRVLTKVLSAIEAQQLNAVQIAEIQIKPFLGFHHVTVVAYPRHVKQSPFLREPDRLRSTRNIWNFKGVLRRRAAIGRTSKGI